MGWIENRVDLYAAGSGVIKRITSVTDALATAADHQCRRYFHHSIGRFADRSSNVGIPDLTCMVAAVRGNLAADDSKDPSATQDLFNRDQRAAAVL